MSLQKQQDFLARIFTDENLRQNFLSESEKIGAENNLSESEIEDLKTVLPEQLNFFADSLYWKRLREVEKILPLIRKVSGENFGKFFREFSQNFNPQSVKKHLEDAYEFCKFLQKQNISEFAKNAAKYEQAKLEFFGYGKRFVVCKLDFDVRKFSREDANAQSVIQENKSKIAIWIRFGKKVKHFFV
jgi:hypothetical protein